MITRHPASRTLIIHPMGDLDALQAEHYRHQLRSLLQEGYRFLIFDLQDTNYVNSCGLGLFVEFYKSVSRLEGSLKLINCNNHILGLLQQTRLDQIFLQPTGAELPGSCPEPEYDPLHALMSEEILLLSQIHAITEQVLMLDDVEEIGRLILQGAMQLLQAKGGAFYLLSEDESNLRLAYWSGQRNAKALEEGGSLQRDHHEPEFQVCQQDDVSWHERTGEENDSERILGRLCFRAGLAAPVRGLHRRYGLLLIEAGQHTKEIISIARPLVRTLTGLCGLALEKALLARQLRERNEELSHTIEQAEAYHHSLIDAGRLAAFGVVFSGLSHLINNKMVPLLGYTQLLAQKQGLPEWVNNKLTRLHESTSEINGVAQKLTHLAHPPHQPKRMLDQHELLRPTVDLLSDQIEHQGIIVQVLAAPDAPLIPGEPETLLQALLAILHRACTSFTQQPPAKRWIRIITSANDRNLRFVIEDNGADFDEHDRMDLLDPLVPFEVMEHGRLFNYVIPYNIARHHGGSLQLEPRLEGGKRVIFDLPLVVPEPALIIPAYMKC